MRDYLDNAKNEVKRIDHLIFVSLKYTRTVDVIRSVIERMINVFEFAIDGMIEKAKRKKKIEVPSQPRLRIALVKELYPSERLNEYMDFYSRLREFLKSKHTKRGEYRRHVTMLSETPSGFVEVNIDTLNEYYNKINEFVEYLESILLG